MLRCLQGAPLRRNIADVSLQCRNPKLTECYTTLAHPLGVALSYSSIRVTTGILQLLYNSS